MKNIILLTLCCLLTVIKGTVGECPPSPSDCVDESKFNELSQSDPTYYCQQGAILVGEATLCLRECNAADPTGVLATRKSQIDSFCREQVPECLSVTQTYIDQTQCFVPYEGVEKVVDLIFKQFEERAERIECNELYWGTYCMREQTCQYNKNLYSHLISKNPKIVLALAVCGSEKARELATIFDDETACQADLNSRIEAECNIACKLAATEDSKELCGLLEEQAACIERLAGNCRAAEERYALPRFDTYAIANKQLGCDISYYGIKVQANADSTCEYSKILNTCFKTTTVENALLFTRLHAFFNRDLFVGPICRDLAKFTELVSNCTTAYLACRVPQAKLFNKVSFYQDTFAPEMGAFPVNSWGINSLATWLVSQCSQMGALMWTDQICVVEGPPTTTKRPRTTPERTTPPLDKSDEKDKEDKDKEDKDKEDKDKEDQDKDKDNDDTTTTTRVSIPEKDGNNVESLRTTASSNQVSIAAFITALAVSILLGFEIYHK